MTTQIKRIDGQWHKTNGTHLQGHLNASYEEIVSVLGQPTHAVEKSDASWDFEVNNFSELPDILEFDDKEEVVVNGRFVNYRSDTFDRLRAELDKKIVVTLYNWKDGQNYNGPTAPPVEDLNLWSIGGHDSKVVEAVSELFTNSKVTFSN
jgi:hypothetical protein